MVFTIEKFSFVSEEKLRRETRHADDHLNYHFFELYDDNNSNYLITII